MHSSNRKAPPDWILIVLLLIGLFLWQRTSFPLWNCDLFHIQLAGYFWKTGQPEKIYTTAEERDKWIEDNLPLARELGLEGNLIPHYYPPFVSAVLAPVSGIRASVWRNTLAVLNILLLAGFARLILKLCRIPLAFRSYGWALALVLVCYPMARATKLGQLSPVLAFVVWTGLLLLRRGRDYRAGGVLGAVSAVKIFPFSVVLVPFISRKWKAVIVMIAMIVIVYGASLWLCGTEIYGSWLKPIRQFGGLVCPYFGNQSLLGWYARMILGQHQSLERFVDVPSLGLIRIAITSVAGIFSGLALWKIRRLPLTEHLPVSAGIILSAVLLSLPTAWEHYWLFVLPPLGWMIHTEWRRGRLDFRAMWAAAAVFLFTMKLTHFYYGDTLFSRLMSGSQTVGLLMFWIWLIGQAWILAGSETTESPKTA